jgi:protoheme ferro-lyase
MTGVERTAVLLLAHGTPDALEEIPEYLRNVTSGRPCHRLRSTKLPIATV